VVALIIITFYYAWQTHLQAEASTNMIAEMAQTRELTFRPEILLWSVPARLHVKDEQIRRIHQGEEWNRYKQEGVILLPLSAYEEAPRKELRRIRLNLQNSGNGPGRLLIREAWFGDEYHVDDSPASLASHETRWFDLVRKDKPEPAPDVGLPC